MIYNLDKVTFNIDFSFLSIFQMNLLHLDIVIYEEIFF